MSKVRSVSKSRSVSKEWEFVSKGTEISLGKFVLEHLMDIYITLMMLIGHLMRLPLTKLENIALIIITIPIVCILYVCYC